MNTQASYQSYVVKFGLRAELDAFYRSWESEFPLIRRRRRFQKLMSTVFALFYGGSGGEYVELVNLEHFILNKKIGYTDTLGFQMRLDIKRLTEYHMKQLAQRLIDEHDKRDTNEGDELS